MPQSTVRISALALARFYGKKAREQTSAKNKEKTSGGSRW
jgi:hypothetical protein